VIFLKPVSFPGELFQDSGFPQKAEEPPKIDALGELAVF
jgi:hypothetical protein